MTHNHKHIPITATFELVGDDHNEIRVTIHQIPEMDVAGVDDYLSGDTVLSFRQDSEVARERMASHAIGMMVQTLLAERANVRAEQAEAFMTEHPELRPQIREAAIENIVERMINGELPVDTVMDALMGNNEVTTPNDEKDEGYGGLYL